MVDGSQPHNHTLLYYARMRAQYKYERFFGKVLLFYDFFSGYVIFCAFWEKENRVWKTQYL